MTYYSNVAASPETSSIPSPRRSRFARCEFPRTRTYMYSHKPFLTRSGLHEQLPTAVRYTELGTSPPPTSPASAHPSHQTRPLLRYTYRLHVHHHARMKGSRSRSINCRKWYLGQLMRAADLHFRGVHERRCGDGCCQGCALDGSGSGGIHVYIYMYMYSGSKTTSVI